jgi:hypothetical protein
MWRSGAAVLLGILLAGCGGDLVADPGPGVIAPTTQVVRILFMEDYSNGLARFGLRDADSQIRNAIRAHLREHWSAYDVAFVMTDLEESRADQARVATVEIRGAHPSDEDRLSNDNSICEKDESNQITDEYVGGYNQAVADCGFDGEGGVFVNGHFYFATQFTDGKAGLRSSSRFDQVFRPYAPELGGTPIDGSPSPGDAEAEVAVNAFGAMVAATTTTIVGFLCGLPYGLSGFHRDDDTGTFMDSSLDRTFEERAQLDGMRERFHPEDAAYLAQILPRR